MSKLKTIPTLGKWYQVRWTFYYNFRKLADKHFEKVTKSMARELVRTLLQDPLTVQVEVSDYEGNLKVWTPEDTAERNAKRYDLLYKAANNKLDSNLFKELRRESLRYAPILLQLYIKELRKKHENLINQKGVRPDGSEILHQGR